MTAGSYYYVVGLDEVGRGALAGPAVVAAVLLPASVVLAPEAIPEGLRDSKLIPEKQRLSVAERVSGQYPAHGVGVSPAGLIDSRGITYSLASAAETAFHEALSKHKSTETNLPDPTPDNTVLLLDGSHDWLSAVVPGWDVLTRVKGDKECASMAAASILAKVFRDSYMKQIPESLNEDIYGWSKNKGYGSQQHRNAIKLYGPHEEHRLTWIKRFLPESE